MKSSLQFGLYISIDDVGRIFLENARHHKIEIKYRDLNMTACIEGLPWRLPLEELPPYYSFEYRMPILTLDLRDPDRYPCE